MNRKKLARFPLPTLVLQRDMKNDNLGFDGDWETRNRPKIMKRSLAPLRHTLTIEKQQIKTNNNLIFNKMQKKILLSLLIASPTALPALANIDYGHGDWASSGVSSDDNIKIDNVLGDVTSVLGSGTTSWKLTLPVGNYVLSFTSTTNLGVTVKGAVKDVVTNLIEGTGNSEVKFTVTTAGEVTIETTRGDKAGSYAFTGASLALDFDFVAAGNDLQTQLDALTQLVELNKDITAEFPGAKEVLDTQKTLTDTIKGYQDIIDQLKDEATDSETLKGIYADQELYNTPSKLSTEIENLEPQIEEWNDAAKALNNQYTNSVNKQALLDQQASLLEEVDDLVEALTNKTAPYDNLNEYTQEAALEYANDLKSKVEAFEDDINNAYADEEKLSEDIINDAELKEQATALEDALGDIDNVIAEAKADWEAYQTYMNTVEPGFENAFTADKNAIDKVTGPKGYEELTAGLKTDALAELNDVFNKAANGLQIKGAKGAAALLDGDKATVEKAKKDMQKVVDDLTAQVNNATQAAAQVDTFNTKLTELQQDNVPEAMQDAYDAAVEKVNDAITALEDYIKEQYGKGNLDLTAADYTDKVQAVQDALDDLQTLVAPIQTINNLRDKFEEAKKHINEVSTKLGTDLVNIESLFTQPGGTFETIQNAIDGLTEEDAKDKEQVKAIEDTIDDSVAIADDLATVFTNLKAADVQYVQDATDLKAFVDSKVELDKDGKNATVLKDAFLKTTPTIGKGGEFLNAQQKFASDLQNVAKDKTPQEIYDAAQDLYQANVTVDGDKVTYNWQANLDAIELEFAQQVTESNKKYLDDKLAAIKAYVADAANYVPADAIDFTGVDTAIAAIADAITAADTTTKYAAADTEIVNQFQALDNLNNNLKKFTELMGQLVGDKGLQESLENLNTTNTNTNVGEGNPAYEYFNKFINEGENSLQGQLDKIEEALEDALKAYADAEKNVIASEADITNSITTLGGLIKDTADRIIANDLAHTQQLIKAQDVAEALNAAFQHLDEYKAENSDKESIKEWYENTLTKLTELRDALFTNNLAVANAYGKGESNDQNDAIIAEYDRILKEILDADEAMTPELKLAVIKANSATVEAAEWTQTQQDMNNAYRDAISVFNDYYYGLKNQGWKNDVFEVIKRHEDIYQFSQEINQLIQDVTDFINESNNNLTAFTAEEFAAEATKKAQKLIDAINAKVDKLNADAAAQAKAYYDGPNNNEDAVYPAGLHTAVVAQLDSIKKALTDAGLSTDCLATAQQALNTAETLYKANENSETLGLAMDQIADYLDTAKKALDQIDLQTIADTEWAAQYGNASNTANGILAGLKDKTNEDYEFADPDLLKSVIEKIEGDPTDETDKGLIGDMEELNADWANEKPEDKINKYADYKKELDKILSEIEGLAEQVKDSNDNNKDSKDLYDNITGTVVPELEQSYQDLVDYANSMAGGQNCTDPDTIKGMIDDLLAYVNDKDNKPVLNTLKDTIDQKVEAIENAIEAGYPNVGGAEYNYLNNTLLTKVKVAFNDAKAAFLGAEGTESSLDEETGNDQLNEWNDKIDELAEAIADLNTQLNPADFDKEEFQKQAQDLETQLSEIYVALEQTWSSDEHSDANPADLAKADLEEQYNSVKDEIAKVQDYLDNCEEGLDTTEFQNALNEATSALDAEKSDWENAGDRVIAMQDTYQANMENISAQVADTLAELTAANEEAIKEAAAKAANEAAYTRLNTTIDGLREKLENIQNKLATWYPDEEMPAYDLKLTYFKYGIDAVQNNLDKEYEKGALTADSQLPTAATNLSNDMDTFDFDITYTYAELQRRIAGVAIAGVNQALKGHLVPEEREQLEEKYYNLLDRYQANVNLQHGVDSDEATIAIEDVTVEVLDEVIAEYKRIAAEAQSLETAVKDQTYVVGDVDLNPDGEVTAVDVQMIIRWVLEGKTWDELYEENPRQAYAADLNDDQNLNITDITLDIEAMFNPVTPSPYAARLAANTFDQASSLGLMLVSEENGVRRYAITLDNTMEMIAGQLDFTVPSDTRIVGISAADRAASHDVQSMENSDRTRVVIYSMDNAAFEGNSGALLFIDVEGSGELKVQNVAFTDSYFKTHELAGSDTTFIENIVESAKELGNRFYNAAGVMFNKLQKGINIFRDSDGKVKKQYNRK